MKRILCSFLLVLTVLLAAPALALDRCMTGSWFDPGISHEGLVVEVLPSQTVAYWYTYRFFDGAEQNWLVFQGPAEQLAAYDVVPAPEGTELYLVGSGSLVEINQNTLQFSHDFTLNLDRVPDADAPIGGGTPWCLSVGCAAVYTLQRLTQPIACE